MWKSQISFYLNLFVLVVILPACQPSTTEVPTSSAVTETPTITPTLLPPVVPNRIELLTQLTIGKINQMALSPDGSRLAIASVSGLYLYRETTLERIWSNATSGSINQVIWSSDGNWLGGIIGFSTLVAWDANTGNLINSLETQTEYIRDLQWLPGNDRLIWMASDPIVRIWNPNEDLPVEINTADLLGVDIVEGGPASFNPDVSLVAISGWKFISGGDYTMGKVRPLIMMDVAIGKPLYMLEDVGLYSDVVFNPDGSLLLTGSSIRNPRTGEVLRTLEGNPDSMQSVTFSPDGTKLSARTGPSSIKNYVSLWNVETGKLLHVFDGHDDYHRITATASSSDGSRFATGSSDKTVIIWDVKTGELLQRITGINTDVIQMEFSLDGNTIFVLPEDAHVVAWDVLTGTQLRDIRNISNIRKLAWTADSSLLAVLSVNAGGLVSNVSVWDVKEKKIRSVIPGSGIPKDFPFRSTEFLDGRLPSSDGKMIASAEAYVGELEIQDAATGKVLFSSPVNQSAGKSLAWSPVKPILAVTDGTARVLIWNGETGETRELTAGNGTFWQVGWSADGGLLATVSNDLLIWDTATWKLFQTLPGSLASNQVVFSPDGKLLATGTWEGIISLWELLP